MFLNLFAILMDLLVFDFLPATLPAVLHCMVDCVFFNKSAYGFFTFCLCITEYFASPECQLQALVLHQAEALAAYQEQLMMLQNTNVHLLQALCGQRAPHPETPRVSLTDIFDGTADHCKGFLRQCDVYFSC